MFFTFHRHGRENFFSGKMHHGGGIENATGKIFPGAPNQSLAFVGRADLLAQRRNQIFFHAGPVRPQKPERDPRQQVREAKEQPEWNQRQGGDKSSHRVFADAVAQSVTELSKPRFLLFPSGWHEKVMNPFQRIFKRASALEQKRR